MAIQYTGDIMGTMVLVQNEQEYELQIRQGNCLAVIIHIGMNDNGTLFATLMDFFSDEQHLKIRCKNVDKGKDKKSEFGDIKSICLNMRYKECSKILKHLVKYYEINCYYE